jgi:predicted nucleic acid-binding protein
VKLVVDSSVFLGAAAHRPYRQLLNEAVRRKGLLLSSVVVMELYAGFKSQESRRVFTELHRNLHRTGSTVVTENEQNFELWRDGLARSGRRLVLQVVKKA